MKATSSKIAIQGKEGLLLVNKQEIMYAMAKGNHTEIYLADHRKVRVLRKLKEVFSLLPGTDFIRIHRSYIVNLEHVVQFNQIGSGQVYLMNGQVLPVARNRKSAFLEQFIKI